MSIAGLVLDVFILAALGATIFYCLRLSRQFNQLQADRKAFETLIQSLTVAASRAEAAIKSLKEAAIESGDGLQEKINNARSLFDELEIMIQAGDNLAERLQTLAEKGRRSVQSQGGGTAEPRGLDDDDVSAVRVDKQPKSRAEKELMEALKAKQK